MKCRKEKDSLGTVCVPEGVYYGPQTERARQNTIESGLRLPSVFLNSLAMIKWFAAEVNASLELLETRVADAIADAAREVMSGRLDTAFVIDLFQTGSGTSTNMNMNEVIAARANEKLTGNIGGKTPVHPNDHVNLGQSSNDVIPTSLHISALQAVNRQLLPHLDTLVRVLSEKAAVFADVRKIGRTHLQDAVPIKLGDAFGGYARQATLSIKRIQTASDSLRELALGGTAVGNGLNTHPGFAVAVIARINEHLGMNFEEAHNHFEAQGARDAAVEMSGALKGAAVSLTKIANDIRWLASGPRCGLAEIRLPELQPGSSIMPGKINPVVPEIVLQIAAQVIGNDTTITFAGQKGNFELNTMQPLIAHSLIQSIRILGEGAKLLAEKCIDGIQADRAVCASHVEKSLAVVTFLVPIIGYDRAAELSRKAYRDNKAIRDVVIEAGVLTSDEFDDLVNKEAK